MGVFTCVCVCVYIYMHQLWAWCPGGPEEGIRAPWNWNYKLLGRVH